MSDRICIDCGDPISPGWHVRCHRCAWRQRSDWKDARARDEQIRKWVQEADMTATELGRALGVSRQRAHVREWIELSDLYGVAPSEIVRARIEKEELS